jgi:hypothetical protein
MQAQTLAICRAWRGFIAICRWLLRVSDCHVTGKADGAMRQNFLINGGDGFLKGWQMLVIHPLAGWQANGHGVYLPVIDQHFIMEMRAG